MALQIVLLGPPASGKGTQGRRLAATLGIDYLSTGALLRGIMRDGGPYREEMRPILARGGYLPDEWMCEIMHEWLSERSGHWVLDGFPRTLEQSCDLRERLAEKNESLDVAVALQVPKAELIRRIEGRVECPTCHWSGQDAELGGRSACPKCGAKAGPRADDDLGNFLSRYDEYERHTVPVIEDYAARGLLSRCDATRAVEVVAAGIEEQVRNLIEHGEKA